MKMVDIQQINRELVCDPAGFARQANAAYADGHVKSGTPVEFYTRGLFRWNKFVDGAMNSVWFGDGTTSDYIQR